MAPEEIDQLMSELRTYLKAHHGGAKKLAAALGVSEHILSRWINRRKDPGLKNYLAIRRFLDAQK
jgi:DNA-binding transcriptional regulator YdaS (Cro superfamily)